MIQHRLHDHTEATGSNDPIHAGNHSLGEDTIQNCTEVSQTTEPCERRGQQFNQ